MVVVNVSRNESDSQERGKKEEVKRERWSSGKRSEPGPWGAATDEVVE